MLIVLKGVSMLRAMLMSMEVFKWGPSFRWIWFSTILLVVFPRQLRREMGPYLPGSFGYRMGTISALFQI